MKTFIKTKSGIVVCSYLIALSVIGILPFLFHTSLFFQHDYEFHIARMEAYFHSISHLAFFPKIFYDYANGAGYAVDLFYPSLFLLPYALLRLCGFSITISYILYNFLLMLLMSTTSLILSYKVFKKRHLSMLFAACYSLSNYRFFDQIIRGAIGEVLAIAFLPVALFGLYAILFDQKGKWYLTVGMSALILSHLLSAYMLFIFILLILMYALLTKRHTHFNFKQTLSWLSISGVSTLCLTIWQIAPILEQSRHFKFNYALTTLQVPSFDYRLSSFANLVEYIKGFIVQNLNGESQAINILVILFLIILTFFYRRLHFYEKSLLIGSWLFLWLSSDIFFPWSWFKQTPIAFIQFPFRWSIFFILLFSFLLTYVISQHASKSKVIAILSISLIMFNTIYLSLSFSPSYLEDKTVETIFTHPNSFGGGQEYTKYRESYLSLYPQEKNKIQTTNKQLKSYRTKNTLIVYGDSAQSELIITPFLYYYGYQVQDEQHQSIVPFEKNGRVAFYFPKGEHELTIRYQKTGVQRVTALISASFLFILVVLLFKKRLAR